VGQDEIARRAYERFLNRGCEHGRDLEDWLLAEQEIQQLTERPRVRRTRRVETAAS
jgi:hypothetical protein